MEGDRVAAIQGQAGVVHHRRAAVDQQDIGGVVAIVEGRVGEAAQGVVHASQRQRASGPNLAAATPGLNELVTIGKIWELAQLDRKVKHGRKYDLVIVDAPATGHGISFLQTPRTFASIARVGPIHSQALQLEELITDRDQTGTVLVSLPEEMPVNETANLEAELSGDIGIAIDRVIMNALYPETFSRADVKAIGKLKKSGDDEVRAAGRAAASQATRAAAQREQLARLEQLVKTEVTTLPFIFKPELDLKAARQLAEEIN